MNNLNTANNPEGYRQHLLLKSRLEGLQSSSDENTELRLKKVQLEVKVLSLVPKLELEHLENWMKKTSLRSFSTIPIFQKIDILSRKVTVSVERKPVKLKKTDGKWNSHDSTKHRVRQHSYQGSSDENYGYQHTSSIVYYAEIVTPEMSEAPEIPIFTEVSEVEFQEAFWNFQQRISFIIAEILFEQGVEDPTEVQVDEIWAALNADALFLEELADILQNRDNE